MPKAIKFIRFILPGNIIGVTILLGILFFTQASDPATCAAQGNCPEPAANDRQPFPDELVDHFEQAGTDRLGNDGPDLPLIWKGYPPANAKEISSYVPCILLKAMGQTESTGWKQFDANYDENGDTVIRSDCGYGIMQITSGMGGGAGFAPDRVAAEPAYNIGTGARILIEKWNGLDFYIGNNNPHVVEDWYYAVWSYNGWGWVNNPNNNCPIINPDCGTAWNPQRPPFSGNTSITPRRWYPYQELVWGYAANPPTYQGEPFWEAVPLTLPENDDVFTTVGGHPPTHIDAPLPTHGSCSVSYLPAILKNYCAPRYGELLVNGDFDAGASTGWTATRSNSIATDPIIRYYYSGDYVAELGEYNNNQDQLYQTICLPSSLSNATLSYLWLVLTNEASSTNIYDTLEINLRDANGNYLQTLQTLTNLDKTPSWKVTSLNLSGYAGQTIQISFEASTDSSLETWFWLNNVSLVASP